MEHAYLITDTAYKKFFIKHIFLTLCIDMISEEIFKTKIRI